jgi:xanthine dehydrogenase accessory factor
VLRAPCAGVFHARKKIGDPVTAGEIVAFVNDQEIRSEISGLLRGILPDGIMTCIDMKCGDVDPRCDVSHCRSVSDKARAISGSVLTAILMLCAAYAKNVEQDERGSIRR